MALCLLHIENPWEVSVAPSVPLQLSGHWYLFPCCGPSCANTWKVIVLKQRKKSPSSMNLFCWSSAQVRLLSTHSFIQMETHTSDGIGPRPGPRDATCLADMVPPPSTSLISDQYLQSDTVHFFSYHIPSFLLNIFI